MRHCFVTAAALALAGLLSGCSAAGFFLTGCGGEEADLVVYNDSTAILGSITISGAEESQSVSLAAGSPLERGESYGFTVDHTGRMTVEVWDLDGNLVGQCPVNLEDERLYVTLKEHGQMTVSTIWREQE